MTSSHQIFMCGDERKMSLLSFSSATSWKRRKSSLVFLGFSFFKRKEKYCIIVKFFLDFLKGNFTNPNSHIIPFTQKSSFRQL